MKLRSTLTLLTLVITPSFAGTNTIESLDILPDVNLNELAIIPYDGSPQYNMRIHSSPKAAPTKNTIFANVYLWWIARDTGVEFVQSYTSFPTDTVSVQVYDAFGNTIAQSRRTSEGDKDYQFVFEVQYDEPTPIVLLFDVDAKIRTATYDGTPIDDTFVPTAIWIAATATHETETTLNVAIPTVGQLYAIGGSHVIDQQLSLMATILAGTPAGLTLLSRIRDRVTSIVKEYRERDGKAWPTFIDCKDCPLMAVIPSGNLSPFWSDAQNNDGVSIQSFAMSVSEISQKDFEKFADESNLAIEARCYSRDAPNDDRTWNPTDLDWRSSNAESVTCISWEAANSYVDWMSARTGKQYRLLTLAESLYASERYLLDLPDTRISGLIEQGVQGHLEWVRDCWSDTALALSQGGSAEDGAGCARRTAVLIDSEHVFYRWSFPPAISGDVIGFRVGRDLRQMGEKW